MPPRQFRTQAIVLNRRDFGEADRLLTLFTPAHGKIRAIAKGARKPSAKVSGHVELFARSDCLIHKGRNLDILTQAELIEPYLGLREDLRRGAYANYVAELLDRFTADEEEAGGDLFTLLHQTLARIAETDDPRLAARFFELQLLDMAGFRPELNECVISREALKPEPQWFSHEEGGVVSRAAAPLVSARLVEIDFVTLKLLRHLQRSADAYERVGSLRISPEQHSSAERIMLGYIVHLLERKLESVDFIRRLRQFSPGA
ncbi:MAG: DNA repair protein RecO [Chloroflexota bacterium]|nr:DNA repair protein RecO [Chloroflexota bacterium]MDE2946012.1 DNA repair protein RecO [Chloroflexota bacterium]